MRLRNPARKTAMKLHILATVLLFSTAAVLAADLSKAGNQHRYVVERTFPKGALDGLNADAKASVNRNNAQFGVKWVMSYANAEKTRTFCIYEGPSEDAIRAAAKANKLPVDSVTEVPVTLESK
jgi:hypothetical protein